MYVCIECLEVLVEICFFEMSTYTYNTEVNACHGFEDPHCAEPYGVEIQTMMKSVLADSDSDTTLAFNHFTDHCPELTKLPFASLPRPSRPWPRTENNTSEPTLCDRFWWRCRVLKKSSWAALTHQSSKLLWTPIRRAECSSEITKHGEARTVDASVAQVARAVRTWKSGHHFYEHFVSGMKETFMSTDHHQR